MSKTLLFVGGGIETLTGVIRAQEKGITTVVSDGSPDAPCLSQADHSFIASTYDVEATIAGARRFSETVQPLDGVISVATDVPLTVASVAEALGLPGIPVEAARLASEKMIMKDRFKRDGLPIPWYAEIASASELDAVLVERGFPLIIKPVDSRGARGVRLMREPAHVIDAYDEAKENSPTGRVMVESFLNGPQLSTEAWVQNGTALTVGYSDRNYGLLDVYAPHVIEDGGDVPAAMSEDGIVAVDELMTDAARSLGMSNGVLKGDIVVTPDGPAIIEVAPRLSGGYFCTHQIPMATGVDFLGGAIDIALGEEVNIEDYRFAAPQFVCNRYMFPPPGTVRAVNGVAEAETLPGVEMLEIRVSPGDVIPKVSNHTTRVGVVVAVGTSREEARARAEAAVNTVAFELV